MDSARIFLLFLLFGFFTDLPPAAVETVPEASGLESVLEKMDRRGGNLRSMSARIIQKKWTDILEEFDAEERGEFHFLRENEAIRLRRDITEPGVSTLLINDGKGIFYQPLLKQANRYDLGARKDRAEFLLLGFTSKKEALREAYSIRWLGPEMVGGRGDLRARIDSPVRQSLRLFLPNRALGRRPALGSHSAEAGGAHARLPADPVRRRPFEPGPAGFQVRAGVAFRRQRHSVLSGDP